MPQIVLVPAGVPQNKKGLGTAALEEFKTLSPSSVHPPVEKKNYL